MLLGVSVAIAQGTEPVRLCYSLPVGTSSRYEATSTLGQRLQVMGRDVVSEVRTDLGLMLTVSDRLMQSSSVQLKWSDGKLSTRTIGGPDDVRTDSVITIPTYGLTQTITITPTGSVISESATANDQSQEDVVAMINATKIPDQLFIPFPTAPVVPGYRWKSALADTSAAPQGRGAVITSGTAWYTYRGTVDTLGKPCWIIEIVSDDLSQYGTLTGAAIELRIDGSGSIHGISIHDARSGLLVSSRTQLETRVVMSSTDQSIQNIRVPVQSQVNVFINRVEGKGW